VSSFLPRVAPLLQAGAVLLLAHVPAAREAVPALGLFTGPLGLVLLAAALLLVLRRSLRRVPRVPTPPAWLLFTLAAVVIAAIAVRYTRAVEPSGDEIDYLLMAQSVGREGDLDLRDNFARGDHLEYLGGLAKMPGGVRDEHGRYRPTHSGGFAVVLAPAYAFGGRTGCVVLLALLAAGLGLLVRDVALRATGDDAAALVAWAASVGPPVFYYTAFLYTEVVVALCIALALRQILWARRPAGAALGALALSALPWLHVRMTLAAVALGSFALLRLRDRSRWAFALTGAAMAAVYALYQRTAFGTLSPLARYGGSVPPAMTNATPARTLVGLFVDGAYGLLPYAPVYLLALAGIAVLARRPPGPTPRSDAPPSHAAAAGVRWALLCAAIGVLLPVLGWRNWWGFSPPARFTIPLVPVLGLALAARLAAYPGRGLARWRWALVAAGLGFAIFLFAEPRTMLMVSGRDGTSRGFDALAGTVSLSRYLPFLSSLAGSIAPPWQPPPSEARVAAVWVAALLMLLVLDALAWTRDRVDRWFAGLALPLVLLLAISSAVDLWARPRPAPAAREAAAADDPHAGGFAWASSSISTRRRYFPTIDFGSSPRNSTLRGTLKAARCKRQNSTISCSLACSPGRSTT
jgi:hypothetical protein